ncbi:MAG: hypothetical protein A2Y45_04205 [Tenericutes bacterium GWC2_34_14]|nr:MAG: hypothetical protein A2Y45_04205 [Tenericutes bacterium GWC2_34_14]OHE33272.1 MAG: hypothetical protein A2012_05985 [Tenericutes bacterium GWE2_34_108]OHE36422.1 MAG: hypothetical protein A2Y46_08090 [Tenericutes bacterium GWF1_35_14]OHE37626.1 MAG: hypothetical protein A2Y44_03015 [Tenericutes bacterium GWF2_35_184]OHE41371.1 MAG: hypothetical protein A3K26_06470 [Tenericutes bacterium RIFOXYA12_FULL_35_10]OHE45097.1 MAG: hypothetical protein A2221_02495 [Tenericutes bacterium RIFOXYA
MSHISLEHVYKSYQKNIDVIKDLSLEIFDDEFLVFVGPSGSGKTTTLRMIAGLEEINSGQLMIDDVVQNDQDPSKRKLSFVFQNYALLPHLTVEDNIGFGLLNHTLTKLEKKKAIETLASKLSFLEKLGSYPHQLSGGQRQRVALARALIDNEKLILFDEPLSNLDAVLRAEMRSELIRLKRQFQTTSIYVTHDQIEAMAMATRIVLMMDGKVIQVGTPKQMYEDPSHLEVATFMGSPEINVFEFVYDKEALLINGENINIHQDVLDLIKQNELQKGYLAIRPQSLMISDQKDIHSVEGSISYHEHFGSHQILYVDLLGQNIKVSVDKDFDINHQVYLGFSEQTLVFDEHKKRIRNHVKTKISFDHISDEMKASRIIQELNNYGYEVIEDEKNPDISYDAKSKHYIINAHHKKKISHVKDILDDFVYIK